MELDVFEILLGHGENIPGISKEDITALFVLRHVLVLALLEVLSMAQEDFKHIKFHFTSEF